MTHRWWRGLGGMRRIAVLMGLVLVPFTVAACGDDSSSSSSSTASTSSSGTTTAAAGGSCVDDAKATLADAQQEIPVQGPSESLDISSLKGKSIYFINLVDNPNNQLMSKGFSAAAKAAGVDGKVTYANGTASDWNKQVSDAIAQKADGIILHGISPKIVSGPLKKAEQAGITVTDVENGAPDAPLEQGVKAHVSEDYGAYGKALTAFMKADSGCKANVLFLTTDVLPLFDPFKEAINGITDDCPDCGATVKNIDLANLATALGPQATNALQRDPEINYVQAAFDAQITFIQPPITAQFPKVKIVGSDGLPDVLAQIRKGSNVVATMAKPPAQWIGWAALDSQMRAMAGKPSDPDTTSVPARLVDKTNVGGSDAEIFPGWEAYPDKFTEQWGVTG